jgi:acyl-CoA thioester hydrolase
MTIDHRDGITDLPCSASFVVAPEWIDIYGHMNASRYFSVFVEEGFALMDQLSLGRIYTQHSRHGIFVVSAHIQYRAEVKVGTPLHVRLRVLQIDHIRLLVLMEMMDEASGQVSATLEQLTVHVGLDSRKATSFPKEIYQRVEKLARGHASIDLPAGHIRYLHCRPASASPVQAHA